MNEKDEKKFGELMLAMGEVFQKIPNKIQMEIYFRALEDLTIEDVSQACSEIVKTRKITGTLPLPAEIREMAGGNSEAKALTAWAKVSEAIDRLGWDNSIAFDDPQIMRAIVLWGGSWIRLRELDWRLDQVKWRQKEFMQAYKAAGETRVKVPEYFIGSYEHHNEVKGYLEHIPKPYLITGIPGDIKVLQGPAPKMLPQISEEQKQIEKDISF